MGKGEVEYMGLQPERVENAEMPQEIESVVEIDKESTVEKEVIEID